MSEIKRRLLTITPDFVGFKIGGFESFQDAKDFCIGHDRPLSLRDRKIDELESELAEAVELLTWADETDQLPVSCYLEGGERRYCDAIKEFLSRHEKGESRE